MNLDLLTKLVKLANNNPNDNEANLAARKVCRMIEEAKFQFKSASRPSKSPMPQNDSIFDFYDWFRKAADEAAKQSRYSKQKDYEYEWWREVPRSEPRKEKKKQMLTCKQCGVAYPTAFVGIPEMYVCYTCQWNEYMKNRE